MFCKNCGNNILDGAKFCDQCGQVLETTHQIPHTQQENRLIFTYRGVPVDLQHLLLEFRGNTNRAAWALSSRVKLPIAFSKKVVAGAKYGQLAQIDHKAVSRHKLMIWLLGSVAIILVFVSGIIGIIGESSNGGNPAAQVTPPSTTSPVPRESKKPEIEYIEITATELLAAYAANEVAADSQYKDKMLKVTGEIKSIGKDLILDTPYVTLKDDDSKYSFVSVQLFFPKNAERALINLSVGDIVTIAGECSGSTLNVILRKCEIQE